MARSQPWQTPIPAGKRTYTLPDYRLVDIGGHSLVVCPKCAGPGLVVWDMADEWYGGMRCTCGYAKGPYAKGEEITRFPLYLQANFRGHVLWAYNWEHLALLEDAIAAELRPGSPSGKRGIRNKLPKWMLLAKNREGILRVIERLRAKKLRRV